jgi:Family of unknown function (DUF6221)
MTPIIEFLQARFSEDAAQLVSGRKVLDELRFGLKNGDAYEQHLSSQIEDGLDYQAMVAEARVRREVTAKRAILELHQPDRSPNDEWYGHDARCRECGYEGGSARAGLRAIQRSWPCPTLRQLAAIYSDHPGYQLEWKPQ